MNRGSRLLIIPAVLVPVVPVVVGLLLITSSSGNAADHGVGSGGHYTPVAGSAYSASTTLAKRPAFALNTQAIPSGPGALVAQLNTPAVMRTSPGGGARIGKLGLRTEFGSPVVMWVERHTGHWLGVVSPTAGNGRIGWIPASATSLYRVNWEIKVSLSQRHVFVFHAGQQVKSYVIAIGKPSAPTPTGNFAVTDRLSTGDPTGPYGCCILATSALAPHAIQDWSGGNRIAIHSTPDTSTIGQAISHGCMHVTLPEGQWLIDHVPLGTPVIIRE
ncbi:MAG TPA: L,D-transpeptidase [Solirubrobacteraceae bacterium]|nr:L,D-transpeptidase [Solirubrobacteraceae bacterium]